MPNCPKCQTPLVDTDVGPGRCPRCATINDAPPAPRATPPLPPSNLQTLVEESSPKDDAGPAPPVSSPTQTVSVPPPPARSKIPALRGPATIDLPSMKTLDEAAESRPSPTPPPTAMPSSANSPPANATNVTIVEGATDRPEPTPRAKSPNDDLPKDDRGVRTLDSVSGEGSADIIQTLDSSNFPSRPPPTNKLTRHIDQTIDQSTDEADPSKRLNKLWGQAAGKERPGVTIRGGVSGDDDEEDDRRTGRGAGRVTLVIRTRAFRTNAETPNVGADYEILEVLGQGGMGVVYRARQASIDREVAIKMLHPKLSANESMRRKFLSEAAVTGELDHPNIVPIYDLGENPEGALFYSMKKVQGTPWSEELPNRSLIDNLTILMKVADAIAFAHARGVVHRDLKPENVMLGDFGEVLVLDWGLAVATDGHRDTPNVAQAYNVAGTPAYMSPELAYGPMEAIGRHSDVYLLGAILYEIVTGQPPHTGESARDCLEAAARNEITPTDKRGELVDIALKALATKPEDRHPSVRAFQDAIRQYQAHSESISLCEKAQQELRVATRSDDYRDYARAVFGFEEAWALWQGNEAALTGISRAKLHYAGSALQKNDFDLGLTLLDENDASHAEVRRLLQVGKRDRDARQQRLKRARRVMLGLAILVFAAVSVGVVVAMWLKIEADHQAGIAVEAAQIARRNEEEARRQTTIAEEQREIARQEAENAEKQRLEAERQAGIAKQNADEARAQEKIADTNRAEAERRRTQAEYEAYGALIGMASAKIDENTFGQAQAALLACPPHLRGWEWGRLQFVVRQGQRRQLTVKGRPECVAYHPSGALLATGTREGVVEIWDLGTNQLRQSCTLEGDNASVTALAFSPHDEGQLAIGSNAPGHYLRIWNWKQNDGAKALRDLTGHDALVARLTYSRDGALLLSASHDHTARVWDVAAGKPRTTLRGHSWLVWSAVFSPDEKQIATASEDGTVRLWDADTGVEWQSAKGERTPFLGHRGPVYAVTFLPAAPTSSVVKAPGSAVNGRAAGLKLASAGYDKRVLLWNADELVPFNFERLLQDKNVAGTPYKELAGHAAAVRDLACSHDGARLLSASNDQTLRLWHARDVDVGYAILKAGTLDKELRGHDGPVQAAVFSPLDARLVASAGYDGLVRLWNVDEYREEMTIPALALRGHQDAILAARFAPDGKSVVTASRDRTAKRWNAADGKELNTYREGHAYLTSRALFDAEAKRLLTASVDGTVRVWSLETEAELFVLNGTGFRAAVALDAASRRILTGSDDTPVALPAVGAPGVAAPKWGAVLWDADTGVRLKQFEPRHNAAISCVALSPDGQWAYSGDDRGTGHLWDARTGEHRLRLDFHVASITGAVFSPDSRTLFTASADKLLCTWELADASNAKPRLDLLRKHTSPVNSLALGPSGEFLVTGCEDGQLFLWEAASTEPAPFLRSPPAERTASRNVNSVAISLDGRWVIAVDSQNDEAILFDRPTRGERMVLRLRDHDALGWSATFAPERSPDANLASPPFITVGGDEARLWNAQGTELANFSPHRPIAFAELSPGAGERLVTASWDHSARLWNAQSGSPLITLNDHTAGEKKGHTGPVHCAVFAPDGQSVLTASEDGTLRRWSPEQRRVLQVYALQHGAVFRIRLTQNGQRFAAACADGTIVIGNVDGTGEPVLCQGHSQAVLDLAFSPDEKFLISGSADTTARIWEVATGRARMTLVGHSGEVAAVALAADSHGHLRALTGSADRTAKLWDAGELRIAGSDASDAKLLKGKELLTLRGHARGVTSVAFSPTDNSILTAGRDGIAILWPADDWAGKP